MFDEMCSSRLLSLLPLLATLATTLAGPLGPLPNVTNNTELAVKEGTCVVGGRSYAVGAAVGGGGCERCWCGATGQVQCAPPACEPRPGCKALHRPDQCCPTYQCECEQEGKVYGNGEKLVDPADPCRVCYCQGGEMVCRTIACFQRDDCSPRRVPGRCCPEYDNCPLRGVVSTNLTTSIDGQSGNNAPELQQPKENVKQEITIKEITPVSEIPIITEVKIKEILPSPGIEIAEYPSSKSPLIPREATSEQTDIRTTMKNELPNVLEIHSTASPSQPEIITNMNHEKDTFQESLPSKVNLPIQYSTNSFISTSPETLMTISTMQTTETPVLTTNIKIINTDEEDTSLLDHNPAFPPIPDDLSVLSNHEEETISEQNMENDALNPVQEEASTSFVTTLKPTTELLQMKEFTTSDPTNLPESITESLDSYGVNKIASSTVFKLLNTENPSTETILVKESPMLNLRSAIPTEILNVPSSVQEDITGELDEIDSTSYNTPMFNVTDGDISENTKESESAPNDGIKLSTLEIPTPKSVSEEVERSEITKNINEFSSTTMKSSDDITTQTELSSLPIETSDQNPQDLHENEKDKNLSSTVGTVVTEIRISDKLSTTPKVITEHNVFTLVTENLPLENVETTEFVLTSFGSGESITDHVELIKISPETEKNAPYISTSGKDTNFLTDLNNLVGDIASIGEHDDRHKTESPIKLESEELLPLNMGYKSKNNNRNLNSITETPLKNKNQLPIIKQKIEFEGDDNINIMDPPPPNDKIEPTTRRPIIDNVTDTKSGNKTEKKDIEIITQSYVPTINKRPTKVMMKKSNEKPLSSEVTTETKSPEATVAPKEELKVSTTINGVPSLEVASTTSESTLTSTINSPKADRTITTDLPWVPSSTVGITNDIDVSTAETRTQSTSSEALTDETSTSMVVKFITERTS